MTFNIDFDGTCTTHDYPKIGKDIGAISVLTRLINEGHKLILFTMRSDKELNDAVDWFNDNNIPLYGIQRNPTQGNWTNSPKSYADKMIDDSAIGCPLIFDKEISKRPFVDWKEIEQILEKEKILTRWPRL
jgi:hypothetical protein